MVCRVHDQVLAHDGQTNEAKVTTGTSVRRSADIDAGKTGAIVSQPISSTESRTYSLLSKIRREKQHHAGPKPNGRGGGWWGNGKVEPNLHCLLSHIDDLHWCSRRRYNSTTLGEIERLGEMRKVWEMLFGDIRPSSA